MNDWQVGDLALCVDDSPCGCCGADAAYVLGRAYVVDAVEWGFNHARNQPILALRLRGVRPRAGHAPGANADRFRKIRPDEHEPCEEEFVTLIRKSRVPETASDWLMRVGPIAKQLNRDSTREASNGK